MPIGKAKTCLYSNQRLKAPIAAWSSKNLTRQRNIVLQGEAMRDAEKHQTCTPPHPGFQIQSYRSPDAGPLTRRTCLVGLSLSYFLCFLGLLSAILVGVINHVSPENVPTSLKGVAPTTILPLLFALIVTFCNECLGFIHTTTLRWALWREGRLDFNSNLRLLTQTKNSKPNAWYVNLFTIFVTSLSYASAGQILLVNEGYGMGKNTTLQFVGFSVPAMGILTFSLFSQAVIATWCLWELKLQTATWSSNALNNSLVCHQKGVPHHVGRSLAPLKRPNTETSKTRIRPSKRQITLSTARPFVRVILGLLGFTVVVTLIWAILTRQYGHDSSRSGVEDYFKSASSNWLHHGQSINFLARGSDQVDPWTCSLIGVGITLGAQVTYTLGLHCTELLVNASRDERNWRCAANLKGKGAGLETNAIKDAFESWETVALFLLKTTIHWVFGEALEITINSGSAIFVIWANPLFVLTGLMALVALFGTYLCFRRHSGPQPAAWGHIQTIVDLVDDWGNDNETLFWGDKGVVARDGEGEIRHAGTSARAEALGEIRMDAKYI